LTCDQVRVRVKVSFPKAGWRLGRRTDRRRGLYRLPDHGYRIKLLSLSGALAGTLERPMPPPLVTARMQEAKIGRRSRKSTT